VGLQLPQFFVSTDGAERPLSSGEAAQFSEVRSDQAPDRSDPSSSGIDQKETQDDFSLNSRNAVNCGQTIEPVGRQCPASSCRCTQLVD